ncbi:DUF4174 domain-containing protein [Methylobacterium sp. 77]|uniref:DUF4174 domain-containing protein n=1 Tax=Methylobacterium sp. 77 TaxID=1101192 RepID=UPI0003AA189D|nr:DUF4174 domain-containing protein [Methylobacterium sp. 77]
MIRPLLLFAVAGLPGFMSPASAKDPLSAYRWTSRVLVIAAPERSDPRIDVQKREALARRADYAERDLVVVEAVGKTAEADRIRRRFGVSAEEFRVVLVGKDGEPKLSEREPIPVERLFATIDAMPMRRDEQRRR